MAWHALHVCMIRPTLSFKNLEHLNGDIRIKIDEPTVCLVGVGHGQSRIVSIFGSRTSDGIISEREYSSKMSSHMSLKNYGTSSSLPMLFSIGHMLFFLFPPPIGRAWKWGQGSRRTARAGWRAGSWVDRGAGRCLRSKLWGRGWGQGRGDQKSKLWAGGYALLYHSGHALPDPERKAVQGRAGEWDTQGEGRAAHGQGYHEEEDHVVGRWVLALTRSRGVDIEIYHLSHLFHPPNTKTRSSQPKKLEENHPIPIPLHC